MKSLDTFVKEARQNKRSIGREERVASVDAQAAIVRVLDAAASEDDRPTDRWRALSLSYHLPTRYATSSGALLPRRDALSLLP